MLDKKGSGWKINRIHPDRKTLTFEKEYRKISKFNIKTPLTPKFSVHCCFKLIV